jgi:hypothetical protein
MTGPERLRDAAKFYLREFQRAANQKDKEYYAECAAELAQMAEALEHVITNHLNKD